MGFARRGWVAASRDEDPAVLDLLYFSLFAPMVLVLAWRPYGLLGRPL